MKTDIDSLMGDNSLWVFAYGSLLWNPAFNYHQQVVGHIKGFKRRFFQGNTNLRGSASNPGRVAILVPDVKSATWGVAYEIRGQQHVRHALEHLVMREISKGGYHCRLTTFHPRRLSHSSSTNSMSSDSSDDDTDDDDVTTDSSSSSDDTLADPQPPTPPSEPFSVLLFTATPASHLYLGPVDLTTMARQVVAAHGKAGPNTEYVLRTAEYVRCHIPEDEDSHLFELEKLVREVMTSQLSGEHPHGHPPPHYQHHHHPQQQREDRDLSRHQQPQEVRRSAV